MIRIEVPATDVQVGDMLINFEGCEVYVVEKVTMHPVNGNEPATVRDNGGWIDITGDTPEGFFRSNYGGPESYYTYPTQRVTVERF